MARRKKSHSKKSTKRTSRRRSRVGAISSDTKSLLMQTLGGIGGAVAGAYVGGVVKTQLESVSSMADYAGYADGAVQLAAGFFLPKFIKTPSPLLKGVQMGLMINGGLSLVKASGVLPGIGAIDNPVPFIAGANDDVRSQTVPFIGSTKRMASYEAVANG